MSKKTHGGVPVVQYPRNVFDFPSVEPARTSKIRFLLGFTGACSFGGFMYAWYKSNKNPLMDEMWNRPDMKQHKPMVAPEQPLAEK
jgi:hypothetical protein